MTGARRVNAAMSRAEALAWPAETLDQAGVEEPKREARLALCEAAEAVRRGTFGEQRA